MRIAIRLLFVATLIAPLSLIGMQSAQACSCLAPDADMLFNDSDGAFVGKLIDSPQGPFNNSAELVPYTFEVVSAHKGDITNPMVVFSAASGASCGLELAINTEASIFLNQDGDTWQGSLCSTMGPEALADFPTISVGEPEEQDGPVLARWALGGLAVAGLGTWAFFRMRKSDDTDEAPTMPAS